MQERLAKAVAEGSKPLRGRGGDAFFLGEFVTSSRAEASTIF
jgi:hypothetical protein